MGRFFGFLTLVFTLAGSLISHRVEATEYYSNTLKPTTLGGKTLWFDVTQRTGSAPYPGVGQSVAVALVATGSTNGTFTVTPGGYTGTWTAAFSGGGSVLQPGNYLDIYFSNLVGDSLPDGIEVGYVPGTSIPGYTYFFRPNYLTPTSTANANVRITDGEAPTAFAPRWNFTLGSGQYFSGSSPQLKVDVTGSFPLSYQWSKASGAIAGATNATLTLTNIQAADAGTYTIVVSNSAGGISTNFSVTVTQSLAITITNQPQSITALSNQNITLTVGATGTQPFSYQWFKDGTALVNTTNVLGATNVTLGLYNLRAVDSGNYTVVISNYVGAVTSAVAVVTVQQPVAPYFLIQPPVNINILTNTSFSISAVATGTPPPLLQWQKAPSSKYANITGATNSTYNGKDTNYSAYGNYRLIAANAYGSVTSSPCLVATYETSCYYGRSTPTNVTIPAGGTMYQQATAWGLPPVNFTLRKNGVDVPNYIGLVGTNAPADYSIYNFAVTNMQPLDSGSYTFVVSNNYGWGTSAVFTVSVQATSAPVILQQPINVSKFLSTSGTIVTNSVTWSSYYPVNVQWYSNNVPINGQANPALYVGYTSTQLFNLHVTLSNQVGVTTSAVVQVSVSYAAGALDTNFVSTNQFVGVVNAVAALTNGGVLAGGAFTTIGASNRNYLAQFTSNGVLTAWRGHTNGFNGVVNALYRYADGRVLVGGAFTNLGSPTRYSGIARLNDDGSLDTTFLGGSTNTTPFVNPSVLASAVRASDGAIAIGGTFTNVAGQTQRGVALLDSNGAFQTNFRPALSNTGIYTFSVSALAFQPDGKLLIGGAFSSVNGSNQINIARLNTDGTRDTNFTATLAANAPPVTALLVQPDGHICLAGQFSAVNGQSRSTFARVQANGTLDPAISVNAGGQALALQSGGNIIFSGYGALGRILTNDTVDANFPGAGFGTPSGYPGVQALSFADDGSLWIGGSFNSVGLKSPQYNLARLAMEAPVVSAPSFGTPILVTGSMQLRFTTVNGRSYEIQSKTSMSAATWDLYQAISGDGTTKTVLIPVSGGAMFFRVALLP